MTDDLGVSLDTAIEILQGETRKVDRLRERVEELEGLVIGAWEEGWCAGWDCEPEKDAWRESDTRQALQEDDRE